jgi:large subunit ribosomal protein L24
LQTTLLGIAIAIILALVAALVGPLLLDWGSHRSLFEAEASRLIGVNVRVTGSIDARLLPSPRLTLNDIQIGDGSDTIRARSLGVEFSLGHLMRAEWRAAELHVVGPQISVGVDASGHLQAPSLSVAFRPDELSIDRLSIEDGTIVLADAASGASLTLGRVWFNGEARSLAGPVKGEGAVTVSGALYPYRLAMGRVNEAGTVKLRLNVDPTDHPLNFEADGNLAVTSGTPRFDGTLSLARPVGIGLRRSGPATGDLTQPWRIAGKVKATAQSALLQDVEFHYGSDEQGFKLTGVADLKFGVRPRLDAVLSGRQIDVDRAVSGGGNEKRTPAAVIRQLAAHGATAFRTTFPVQVGVGIDQLTLGGNALQNLRADISSNANGWNLDRLEFRAPGVTQVRLGGRLAVDRNGFAFTGPAQIDSSDPRALALWLEGRNEATPGDVRPLSLRGDVTLASDRIAVEQLKAEFDRRPVTGRLAYVPASGSRPARLEAELKTPQLDVEAALGFGRALFAGSTLERPRDMTIAMDIGRLTFGGVDAREAHVRLNVDADNLRIDRLAVGDIGGGSFTASGRIDTKGNAPSGSLAVDLETTRAAAIAAIAEKFVPDDVAPAVKLLERASRAKLHATLDVGGGSASGSEAKLVVTGSLDDLRVDARTLVRGDWSKRTASDVELNATVDAATGASLLKLTSLDGIVVPGTGPAQLKLRLAGPAGGDMSFDVQVAGNGLSAKAAGSGRLFGAGRKGTATVEVKEALLHALRPGPAPGGGDRLPLQLVSRITFGGGAVKAEEIKAKLGASTLHGRLQVEGASPRRVEGTLDADSANIGEFVACLIGLPRAAKNAAGWAWSSEPFGSGLFGEAVGKLSLRAGRAQVLPNVTGRDLRGTLRLDGNSLVLEGAGEVAGGKLDGTATFRSAPDGLTAQAKVSLAGADAAAIASGTARPPVTGSLNFDLAAEATGLSAVALIGSAKGSGTIALTDAQFARLDPRTFDVVTRAVDQGMAIEQGRIADVVRKSIVGGRLSVSRARSALTLSAGQIRLSKPVVESQDAALDITGSLDLIDGLVDARLVLSGQGEATGARPDIFIALKGPLPVDPGVQAPVSAISYNVDVSALTGWLTLRAVENQTKQLRAIERVPSQPAIRPAPKINQAPPLPAPTDIKPAPKPRNVGQPAASVRTQN